MIFFNNFQEKVKNILKKIENGNANESNIASLCELLEDHSDLIPEAMVALNNILQKGSMKAYNLAILALNKMAEKFIGLEYYSVDIIINSMRERKNDLRENGLLNLLGTLSKITQKYPEKMRIAVPELLMCLENSNMQGREMSYFTLSIIAVTHHDFFENRSKELIRVLNGLNTDERIYALKLTKKLVKTEKKIAADTYDLIEDMHLNHPDSKLRSEAGFTMDVLKEIVNTNPSKVNMDSVKKAVKQELSNGSGKADISDSQFTNLSELMAPDKEDLADLLEGMNLKHLIVGKV